MAPSLLATEGMSLSMLLHMHEWELLVLACMCVRVLLCVHLIPLFLPQGSHGIPLTLSGLRNESNMHRPATIMYERAYNHLVYPFANVDIQFLRYLLSAYYVPGLLRSGEATVTKTESVSALSQSSG